MPSSLRDHRIVVAGASSGIGLATARRLAREGASVAGLARNRAGLAAAARAVRADGGSAEVIPVDVTDRAAVEKAMATAAERLGGIDALVASVAGLAYGAFTELSPEDFERSHEITFLGVVNTVRAALPELERTAGTIVAVGSMAGKVSMPLHSPYVAGKFALRGFLGALRVELRSRESAVRVCMVHPGFVGTPFFDHATSAGGTRPHPLPPVYRPEDVAGAIVACLKHPRAEMNVGGSATALELLARVARPVAELLLATYGVAGQRRPDPAAEPGMLWEPSGQGETTGTVAGRRSVSNTIRLAAEVPLDVLQAVPGLRTVVRLVR